MPDPLFPLKSRTYNGWVISKLGDNWQAVDKTGLIGKVNNREDVVITWARNNKAG
jgi:hypothetical protein